LGNYAAEQIWSLIGTRSYQQSAVATAIYYDPKQQEQKYPKLTVNNEVIEQSNTRTAACSVDVIVKEKRRNQT